MEPPVVLFDGVCNLCNGVVDFIIRHDSNERFLFGSLQSDEARQLLGRMGIQPPYDDSIVLVEGDRAYHRSDAVLRIFRRLGFPWNAATIGAVIPKAWRDRLYDWVALNRYRWFGRRDTCRLPTAAERARFLDDAPAHHSGADS